MSVKSQENNMRRLAALLEKDLGYIWGERESGPNGDKRVFLNVGKAFLRALGRDLGLRNAVVTSNPGGIALSGECTLTGMWENGGIRVCIGQPACGGDDVLLYRSIRNLRDNKGGYDHWLTCRDLETMSYDRLLNALSHLRREVAVYGYAA